MIKTQNEMYKKMVSLIDLISFQETQAKHFLLLILNEFHENKANIDNNKEVK